MSRSIPFWKQLLALDLVVSLGLASRHFPGLFPEELGKYPGDALWAWMVLLLWAIARPGYSAERAGWMALLTCFAVEASQLYQAPWIVAIRGTTVGHLVLGTTFNAPDLAAYLAGILMGLFFQQTYHRIPSPRFELASMPKET